jgi:dUTP pyrophosphatase
MFIRLGATALVKTDIAILIPEGHVGKIEDRSGLAAKGLRTGAGVVDNGYTGEVKVVLHNLTHSTSGGYQIKAGDRIAQLLIYPVSFATAMEIDNLGDSQRKDSGFGSSGT